jgi:hypothetical protein
MNLVNDAILYLLFADSRMAIIFSATPLAEAGFCPVTRFPSAMLLADQGAAA